AVFLAVAAVLAGPELRAVGIGVWLRRIGGRPRGRMIAGFLRRIREHHARKDGLERRPPIVARAWRLERIAALLDRTAQVSRLAGDRGCVFEAIVIGLELRV